MRGETVICGSCGTVHLKTYPCPVCKLYMMLKKGIPEEEEEGSRLGAIQCFNQMYGWIQADPKFKAMPESVKKDLEEAATFINRLLQGGLA